MLWLKQQNFFKVSEVTANLTHFKGIVEARLYISYSEGSVTIVLWENDVTTLTEGISFERVTMREYAKYLSMSEGAKIEEN